jgi:hypothetical protein
MNKKQIINAINDVLEGDGDFYETVQELLNSTDVEDISELDEFDLVYLADVANIDIESDLIESEEDEDLDIEYIEEDEDLDIEYIEDEEFGSDDEYEEDDNEFLNVDNDVIISNIFDGFVYANKKAQYVPEFVNDLSDESLSEWATSALSDNNTVIDLAKLLGLPVDVTKNFLADVIKYSNDLSEYFSSNIDKLDIEQMEEPEDKFGAEGEEEIANEDEFGAEDDEFGSEGEEEEF